MPPCLEPHNHPGNSSYRKVCVHLLLSFLPLGIVTRSEPSSAGMGQEKRLSLWECPSMKSQSNIYTDCTFFLDLEKHELQMRRADFSLETFRKLSNKSNRLLWNPGKLLSLRFPWFYRRVPALYFFIKATKRLSFFFKVWDLGSVWDHVISFPPPGLFHRL